MGFVYYINRGWCVDASVVITHCSPLTDCFLTWNSAGFFLSREFSVIMVMPAYILPGANANETLHELHNAISDQKKRPTPRVFFFFHCSWCFQPYQTKNQQKQSFTHNTFPNIARRGGNMFDLFYSNICDSHKAIPVPHLGHSYHLCVFLFPAYRSLLKLFRPIKRTIRVLLCGAITTLQHCFESTGCNIFMEAITYD